MSAANNEPHSQTSRSALGRIKFGQRKLPAIVPALPGGLVLAAALTAIGSSQLGFAFQHPSLGALILGPSVLPPAIALVWILVVDRSTLSGALDRPAESVETAWYDKAVRGAFHDVLLVVGVATTVLSITRLSVDGSQVLLGVLVLCGASVGVRYLIHRRRG